MQATPAPGSRGEGLRDGLTGEDVERYLRANPGFLAARLDLYRHMDPPRRLHGDGLADHMQAMLQAERARTAAALAGVPDRRAAAGTAARVQDAVLALMRSTDPAECVEQEFPGLLGIDAARLVMTTVPDAAAALAHAGATIRPPTHASRPLHAEAAPLAAVEALVRVRLPSGEALLVLASRDERGLDPRCVGEFAFLGRAVAAALGG